VALGLLEDRGLVVRIISAPDAWWVLAGERETSPAAPGLLKTAA
jgi:hypothetical protein